MKRRWVLLLTCALLAAPTFAPRLIAAEIVSGVHLIPGKFVPGSQPDGNTVIMHTRDGLVVIDTGRHRAHADAILEHAHKAQRPLVAVVNTHWHLDHVGGNAVIREKHPAVKIYASDALSAALRGFLADYRKQLEQMLQNPKTDSNEKEALRAERSLIDAGHKLAPDIVWKSPVQTSIAGRSLQIGFETAVTAGDVWLLDEATGVLVAGDLVTLPAPFLDTACPERWNEVLQRLAKIDFAVLIPGHGSPITRKQFNIYRSAFGELLKCAADTVTPKEQCIGSWMDVTLSLNVDRDERFTRALMDYYVGRLRDPSAFQAFCGH